MDLVRQFEQQQIHSTNRPRVRAGDLVRVETTVKEGDKSRLQAFEGTVLGVRGSGPSTTFTVRRVVGRFAVERVFPLYSPTISTIDIVKRQKVRRAKLTYLRMAARRHVKEDELATQRLRQEEQEKKRLAEEAKKRAEEAKARAEQEAARAQAKREREAREKAEAEQATAEAPKMEKTAVEKTEPEKVDSPPATSAAEKR